MALPQSRWHAALALAAVLGVLASTNLVRGQGAAASRSGGLFGRDTATVTGFDTARPVVNRPIRARPAASVESVEEIAPEAKFPHSDTGPQSDGGPPSWHDDGFVVDESGGPECGDIWGDGQCYHWLDNLWIFGGVQGFKGPVDQGINGNFGVQGGFNYTIPLSFYRNIGAQVGARFMQSDLAGSALNESARRQTFVTAGLFHRVPCGWQFGAAFDSLHDEFYTEFDVQQVRAELSWVSSCGNEIGVMAAASTADDNTTAAAPGANAATQFFHINDQFALYYRVPFACGGEGRIYGGGTSDRDGLVGGEIQLPINPTWSVQAAAVYLIPEESSSTNTNPQAAHYAEQWGLSVNLVWYPGQCPVQGFNPWRPMFGVADNTSMLIDRRPQ